MARILVVDDSLIARKFIKRILQNTQHEVVGEAENGEQAIEQYKLTKPDIITMDIDMPVMDGIESSRNIFHIDPNARIILVTAHEQNDLVIQAKEINVNHFINKPVSESSLLVQIDKILKGIAYTSPIESHSKDEIPLPSESFEQTGNTASHSKIKKDQIVVVEHYSSSSNLHGLVLTTTEDTLLIKLTKHLSINSFNVRDTVVVGHKYQENLYLYSCWVKSINMSDKTLELIIDAEENLTEAQNFDSLPVSLYIDVKDSSFYKKHSSVVKRFAGYGMTMLSHVDYREGDNIDFDLYLLRNIYLLKARVNTMRNTLQGKEYDVTIVQSGLDTYKQLKKHVEYLLHGYVKNISLLD